MDPGGWTVWFGQRASLVAGRGQGSLRRFPYSSRSCSIDSFIAINTRASEDSSRYDETVPRNGQQNDREVRPSRYGAHCAV